MLTEIFDYYRRNVDRLDEKQIKKTIKEMQKVQKLLRETLDEKKSPKSQLPKKNMRVGA